MAALTNGVPASGPMPIELSFPLPHAPTTRVHLQLTNHSSSLLVLLTTVATDAPGSTLAPLGSFVYGMPNISNPSQPPLTTPLLPHPATLDFTTRMATALSRKVKKPVYVGCSVSFAGTGLGGTVEEEMSGLRRCVEVISGIIDGKYGVDGKPEGKGDQD